MLGLADRLRAGGIDAEIDQYNAAPPEGWPLWCERQIAAADVLLHRDLSPPGQRCRGAGKGLGVVWEARIIRQFLHDANAVSDKFVPVLFSDTTPEQIPTPIKGSTWYVVDTEDGYEELYRRLTGQPRLLRPALGTIRPLPTRRRQWPQGTMEAASLSPAPASAPAPDHVASVRRRPLVRKLWPFLQEKNRQVLGWLGGGIVVLAGGVWVVVNFFYSSHPPPQGPDIHVEAPGGVGAGRDIRGSTITVHPQAPPEASPSSPDQAPDARPMRRVVRLVLLAWIGLAGFGLEARAQGTVSAPSGVAARGDIRESTIGIPPEQVAVITGALKPLRDRHHHDLIRQIGCRWRLMRVIGADEFCRWSGQLTSGAEHSAGWNRQVDRLVCDAEVVGSDLWQRRGVSVLPIVFKGSLPIRVVPLVIAQKLRRVSLLAIAQGDR